MSKIFTCCFWGLWICLTAAYAQPGPPVQTHAPASVLRSGNWYKIGVTGSGLYQLDRSLLQALGLPVDNLDPRYLQVYGNGGAMLPQLNSQTRADDLIQNAAWVAGESDGRLDAGDYLLFYAPGPHRWQYEPTLKRFVHEYNIYSDTAYYFIRVADSPGLRVKTQSTPGQPTEIITSFNDHLFHEQDLVNVLKSGRNWYGEAFNSLQPFRDFSFSLPDVLPGSTIYLTSAVMGNAEAGSSFQVKANNTLLGTHVFNGRGQHDYHAEGEADTRTFAFGLNLAPANLLRVNLTYDQQGVPNATGYLDYLEVNAERTLKLSGNQKRFRSTRFLGTNKIVSFQIQEVPSGALLWEISNPLHPQALPLQYTGGTASFTAVTDTLREYLIFSGTSFPKPVPIGRVKNQNLHSLNQDGQLDLIIVTHPLFQAQAEKLAQHRRQHDHLQVEVVSTSQVYNEFSSGSQDVTAIRDLMKMLYDRRSSDKPLYLLLFGEASYDYKNRLRQNSNLVPVYQSRESLDPLASYSSEDYFGFLDAHEGWWSETQFASPEMLDVGIGRLPVRTVSEAEAVVAKILHYDSPAGFGKWRNRITLLADDGDNAEHLRDAESLASFLQTNHPAYQARKLYLDLYKQQTLPNGQRAPAINADLNQAIEQGSLILNYTGHGSETTLAHEEILTLPQLESWKNFDRLVFMLTATCEFGRYDDPGRRSGGELALLNPSGGAIGLLTTTRPVFASSNRLLNRSFMQHAFSPVAGKQPRLGDLLLKTKNSSQAQSNNRNFTLLADPTQRLAYPALQAQVSAINALPVTSGITDTLQALQTVSIAGEIINQHGLLQTDFDGLIDVTVYDKPATIKTLGDESSGTAPAIMDIMVQENIVYAGIATVRQGKWNLNFVVPKDISYHVGPGLIGLYAYTDTQDAHGFSDNLAIGGTASLAEEDKTPPQIRLFLDDESFIPGGLTNQHPVLLAHLSDANGINTTGIGIGHEITATLDGDKANAIVLNNYYKADKDNFQSGRVRYPLQQLSLGWHELSLKAWDTHNNAAEAQIRFYVTSAQEIIVENITNFPNPFKDETFFRFDHNRLNEDLDIQIYIFTVTGKIVKRLFARWPANSPHLPLLHWDGRNELGSRVSGGVYLYRLNIRSISNGTQVQKFSRLIKIN